MITTKILSLFIFSLVLLSMTIRPVQAKTSVSKYDAGKVEMKKVYQDAEGDGEDDEEDDQEEEERM